METLHLQIYETSNLFSSKTFILNLIHREAYWLNQEMQSDNLCPFFWNVWHDSYFEHSQDKAAIHAFILLLTCCRNDIKARTSEM